MNPHPTDYEACAPEEPFTYIVCSGCGARFDDERDFEVHVSELPDAGGGARTLAQVRATDADD